ncbi:MAG: hypothetical protein AB1489_16045 [Acidobacteriota bacterium]
MRLNILLPPTPGEHRTLTDRELDQLHEEGRYDSYSRIYLIQGYNWRIVDKICRTNGITEYTLECENEA